MGNVIMAAPNWVAGSTIATPSIDAAGSWEASLPATNVLNRFLSKVARSTDATTASTKIRINLGTSRSIRVLAIPKSNVSVFGRIRATLYSDDAYSVQVATTGWLQYWPDVYEYGVRDWGEDDILTSFTFTAEEAADYPPTWHYVFDAIQAAQYVEIEIDDTSNEDGFIEFGRVVIAPAWQATLNPIYGQTSVGWESRTKVKFSRTGVLLSNRQPSARVAVCAFDYLPEAEAFTYPFDLSRRLDVDEEVFFITDPDDVELSLRRAFLARFRRVSPLSYSALNRHSTVIELEELL